MGLPSPSQAPSHLQRELSAFTWSFFSAWLPFTSTSLHCFHRGLQRGWYRYWFFQSFCNNCFCIFILEFQHYMLSRNVCLCCWQCFCSSLCGNNSASTICLVLPWVDVKAFVSCQAFGPTLICFLMHLLSTTLHDRDPTIRMRCKLSLPPHVLFQLACPSFLPLSLSLSLTLGLSALVNKANGRSLGVGMYKFTSHTEYFSIFIHNLCVYILNSLLPAWLYSLDTLCKKAPFGEIQGILGLAVLL